VVAQGIGSDVESAAKNAAENALTQVVGSFIDTEKQLNEMTAIVSGIRSEAKSISTTIREYSQGSIKSFELIGQPQQQDGFVRVTARVEVRADELKAYVKKLAEGETKVGPGLFPQAQTEIDKSKSIKDVVTNGIVVPLVEGTVIDFKVSSPVLFDEWSTNNAALAKRFSSFVKSSTIVVPFNIVVRPEFFNDMVKTLESVAFLKRTCDPHGSCDVLSNHVDNGRDGFLMTQAPTGLLDVYLLRDIVEAFQIRGDMSLIKVINALAYTNAPYLTNSPLRNFLPNLDVTLGGADGGVLYEGIVERPMFRTGDGNVMATGGWSPFGFVENSHSTNYSTYLVVFPVVKNYLLMNLPEDTIKGAKTIHIKLVPKT